MPPYLCAFSKFDIYNGEQAIFWENRWADSLILKYSLPDLYKLAINKKFSVARMVAKHRRNDQNFFKPIDPFDPNANNVFLQILNFNAIMIIWF